MPSDRSFEPGAPVPEGFIPLSVPNIAGNEWRYVKECLDAGWVSSVGAYVERFEKELAARVGAPYAVATASGTVALHVALLLAGVGPDDEVVLPSLTFIAPANAVRYTGAWPVFVDADPEYWQLDPDQLAAFLEKDCERRAGGVYNRHTGRRVSAVLSVDVLGHPCDHARIGELAARFGLAVVEDATEALGATYRGRPLGQQARLACFSFNGNKVITTGGGGMIVTDDRQLATRARYLTTQAKDDPVEFVHREVGFNYRLTNVQAAMGCAQLELLDQFLEAKRRIARRYADALGNLPGVRVMRQAEWVCATFWLTTILLDAAEAGLDRRDLMVRLQGDGIQARPLWQPLHLSPAHRGSFARPCPVAERLNREALSLPSSTSLTAEQQERVIAVVRRSLGRVPAGARRT